MSLPLSARSPTRPISADAGAELRDREREAWDRDGFFTRPALFCENELAALRAACQRAEATVSAWCDRGRPYQIDGLRFRDVGHATLQYEHDAPTLPRVVEPAHDLAPEFPRLLADPRLVEAARSLCGSARVSLFTDKLNWKRANFGSAFGWHQDSPYWAHLPGLWERVDTLVNVLIYFDDADTRNGCLRVIPGSHREGALPRRRDGAALAPLFVDPLALEGRREHSVVLPAGSLLYFHSHLVHGSHANTSPQARRAMVLTYQAEAHAMFKKREVYELGEASPG